MDRSLIRFRTIDEVFEGKVDLNQCAANGTSHVLQIMWSEPSPLEILPAMEFTDFWYALSAEKEIKQEDQFAPSHRYYAIGILGVKSKLQRVGLNFPDELKIPFVDQGVRPANSVLDGWENGKMPTRDPKPKKDQNRNRGHC